MFHSSFKYSKLLSYFVFVIIFYLAILNCWARSGCLDANLPPTLKSWQQIREDIGISNIGYIKHIDIESTDGYFLMDIDGTDLEKYISCNSSDGAKRYIRYGYVDVTHKFTGEFCAKWKLGIRKSWLYEVPDKMDNSQFKIFCTEKRSFGDNLTLTAGVNKGSGIWWIDYYFCRDGERKVDLPRNAPNYEFRTYSCNVHSGCYVSSYTVSDTCTTTRQECHTEEVAHCPGGDCTTTETVCEDVEEEYDCSYTEYEDIKEYDTNYIGATGYGINICSMPVIKHFDLINLYDANLLYH